MALTTTYSSITLTIYGGKFAPSDAIAWAQPANVSFNQGTASTANLAQYLTIPGNYGTAAYSISSGSLPSGVTLASNGVLSYDGVGAIASPVTIQIKVKLAVTSFTLTSSVGGSGECWTIGHRFRKGDFPSGSSILADSTAFQFDTDTLYSDGSIKQATLSGTNTFSANTPVTVNLSAGSGSGGSPVAEAMPSGTNTLSLSGIGTLNITALAGSSYKTRLSGAVVSEFHYHATIGSSTTVGAYVYLRNYANGKQAIKVEIHNGFWLVSGVDQVYTRAILTLGGSVVYDSTTNIILDHHTRPTMCSNASGWHWVGTNPDIWPSHNVAYLRQTGAVPRYYPTSTSTTTLNGFPTSWRPKVMADVAALTAIETGVVTAYDNTTKVLTDSSKNWDGNQINRALRVDSGTGAGTISRIIDRPSSTQLLVDGLVNFDNTTHYSIVDQNGLTASMGQLPGWHLGGTGDDASIGYLQRSCAAYVITGDVRALKGMCVDAMASSAMYALHYPDESNIAKDGVSWTTYATYQARNSASNKPVLSLTPAIYFSGQYGGDWDLSHAYMPGAIAYMMTGDYSFLRSLLDAVNWTNFDQDPTLRAGALGIQTQNLQARGIGWANRNLGYAADLVPDSHPYKSQFVNGSGGSFSEMATAFTNGLGILYERQDFGFGGADMAMWESDYAFGSFCMCKGLDYLTGQARADLDKLLTFMTNGIVNRIGLGTESTKFHYRYTPYRILMRGDYDGNPAHWTGPPTQGNVDANWGITWNRYFGFAMGSSTAIALDSTPTIMHSTGDETLDRTLLNWTTTNSFDPWYDTYTFDALAFAASNGLVPAAVTARNLFMAATNVASSAASFTDDPRWGIGV